MRLMIDVDVTEMPEGSDGDDCIRTAILTAFHDPCRICGTAFRVNVIERMDDVGREPADGPAILRRVGQGD